MVIRRSHCSVLEQGDLVQVRYLVRELAAQVGLGVVDMTKLVTAASELARNMVLYAGGGVVSGQTAEQAGRTGIVLSFEDRGPGIADLERAMQDGYSSQGSLGLGLPGARRLVDSLEIETALGQGTRIVVRKWKR